MLAFGSLASAEDMITSSGRLELRGVDALHRDSVDEGPGLSGRIKIDTLNTGWNIHSWIEGGWDGAVKRPARDKALFKNYDQVYQSNTPYIGFKELYLSHVGNDLDLRAGIQRFAWGRLDEVPSNDLLNPWDYNQYLTKSLEDRKIGVPSLSANKSIGDLSYDAVWVPWLIPYRLPLPDERWSGTSSASALAQIPNASITPTEPDLPPRTFRNGNFGVRIKNSGALEWALNLYHGFDPKPVFRATSLVINPQPNGIAIDPGYVPDFHRITSVGIDAAIVRGDWSIRSEAAYIMNRYYNIKRELWGYPSAPATGLYGLNPIEWKTDVLDYGIGADRRLFEDGTLTIQAEQTVILGDVEMLHEKKFETILWAHLKAGWLNQKIETNLSVAYNPEHGAGLTKADAWWVFTDHFKTGITMIAFHGPSQSVFGRYSRNDQVEAELVYSW